MFPLSAAESEVYSDQVQCMMPPDKVAEVWQAMRFSERWPNFTPEELRCKGSHALMVNYYTMDCLQRLRGLYKGPIMVNSYFRCASYNAAVGGAAQSFHLSGRAVDTPTLNGSLEGRMKLCHLATRAGFQGFGLYGQFTHIDTGPVRFWTNGLTTDAGE